MFHEVPYLVRMSPIRAQDEIAFEMMQGIERVLHLVVVQQRQFVMDLGAMWAVVQRCLIKVDRSQEIALGRFRVGVLNELGMARRHHPIATRQREDKHDRQERAGRD